MGIATFYTKHLNRSLGRREEGKEGRKGGVERKEKEEGGREEGGGETETERRRGGGRDEREGEDG